MHELWANEWNAFGIGCTNSGPFPCEARHDRLRTATSRSLRVLRAFVPEEGNGDNKQQPLLTWLPSVQNPRVLAAAARPRCALHSLAL